MNNSQFAVLFLFIVGGLFFFLSRHRSEDAKLKIAEGVLESDKRMWNLFKVSYSNYKRGKIVALLVAAIFCIIYIYVILPAK